MSIKIPTAPSNGFQNVIYKYDNGDTFTLVQGAVSRKTGDSSSTVAFAIMFVLAGTALAGVATYRRKRA